MGLLVDVETYVQGGWSKVRYGINAGYVSTKYTEIYQEADPGKMTLAQRALGIAVSQLGNHEEPRGSNWGPQVKKYLNSVGIDFPAAWCISGVYWCVDEAAKEMGVNNPLHRTGGVLDCWAHTPKEMKVKTPQKGDIFIQDHGGGKGHAGFVSEVSGSKFFTVEFNSNDEGAREGFEVCRKPGGRTIASCIGFIRL